MSVKAVGLDVLKKKMADHGDLWAFERCFCFKLSLTKNWYIQFFVIKWVQDRILLG